jgi:hypothetical protein
MDVGVDHNDSLDSEVTTQAFISCENYIGGTFHELALCFWDCDMPAVWIWLTILWE